MGEPLAEAMAQNPRPEAAVVLFDQMMCDIMGGGACADPMGQVRRSASRAQHQALAGVALTYSCAALVGLACRCAAESSA
jgi:hypothetical protein